jgi:hypothetical protein
MGGRDLAMAVNRQLAGLLDVATEWRMEGSWVGCLCCLLLNVVADACQCS